MKHTVRITFFLVLLFFAAHVVGLGVTNKYIDHQASAEAGEIVQKDLPYGIETPPVDQQTSFVFIIIAVLIGTGLVLLLIHFKKTSWWRVWYLLSVIVTMSIAFAAFIPQVLAFVLAVSLGLWKVYRSNFYVHNFSELFVYAGLVAIFVRIMNLFSIVVLLLLISVYDIIAVWKSKHMIKLAKFATESNAFAGLIVPYEKRELKEEVKMKKVKVAPKKVVARKGKLITEHKVHAILGGGDIGFPLLFAGVVMKDLMLSYPEGIAFLLALIVPVFTTIALIMLFMKGQKDKFYPAMPFLSAGAFVGYGALVIVRMAIG